MSSSKSSRNYVNTHIVETNASGIVTIVIDDDIQESNPTTSDEDSQQEYSSQSAPKATRPAIGVRTPVQPLGSPKFINSENLQNILIKENKTNVIVVNSGRSSSQSSPFRSGQSCMSPTSSCCSSQSLPTEVKTHHNIVSKSQIHYVMINKPKPEVSSPTTSSTFTSSSSPEFCMKGSASPTKLRLWTQPASHSTPTTPRSPTVIISTRTRSQTSLPPEDVESDCMDDKTFFKYLNLIPVQEIKCKSSLDLKSYWPLRKVTKIPKTETDANGNLILSNFKILREPINPVPNLGPIFSERKLRWYKEAQHYNERLQKFKANLPINFEIRERMQTDLERLHKRLMADKQKQTDEEDKYRVVKSREETQRLQREELKQELDNYMNAFEISSVLGHRVRNFIDNSYLSPLEIFKYIQNRIECFSNQNDILSMTAPQNTKLSTRITRSTTGFAGIDRMWGPRNESHQYSFTRRQRLDRYRRLDTGLNWKSRLVKKHCRRIDVEVAKITRCPCCLELVEPEWGHSCRDSDEESIPEVSSVNDSDFCVQSESNFNEEEINSTISETRVATDVTRCECGRFDCDCECVDTTTGRSSMSQISNGEQSMEISQNTVDHTVDRTVIYSTPESVQSYSFGQTVEDKITIQKVAVLHDTSDNKTNIINAIEKKSDSNGIKKSHKKCVKQNDDIVIVSEVTAGSYAQNQQKRVSEPDIIERFVAPNTDTNGAIKRKFSEKRLRSHYRNNSDEIIVKKLK